MVAAAPGPNWSRSSVRSSTYVRDASLSPPAKRRAYLGTQSLSMSFRGRLLLFFMIIVIVPMVAVALVLFSITSDSENGKADAAIAQGMRTASSIYETDRDKARPDVAALPRDRS